MPKDAAGVMREYKQGKLHSGSKSGPLVKNKKQAIAIALSEQRQLHGSAHGSSPFTKTEIAQGYKCIDRGSY